MSEPRDATQAELQAYLARVGFTEAQLFRATLIPWEVQMIDPAELLENADYYADRFVPASEPPTLKQLELRIAALEAAR